MYNAGFRQAAIALYHFFGSMKKTSEALQIGVATVWRWVRKGVRFSPRKANHLPTALKEFVRLCILQENHVTQSVLIQKIRVGLGIQVSRKCIACVLKSIGMTRKRLRNRGKLPSAIPMELFSSFKHRVLSSTSSVVAVDEIGFDQRMTPLYGYAPKGCKAIAVTHPTSRKRYTSIAAIDSSGKRQVRIYETAVDGLTFASFVRSLEWPSGTTIILDNARIHKTPCVREVFLDKGFVAAFTPPYSPDSNPIENIFSWVKNRFRKQCIELPNCLWITIQRCFEELPSSFCLHCFKRLETNILKNTPPHSAMAHNGA
jgi:transposase